MIKTAQPMRRALAVVRLSQYHDATQTGIDKQDEQTTDWIASKGLEFVDFAKDTNVSGGSDPFGRTKSGDYERPGLGPWLLEPERIARYDTIVAAKLDRLARSTRYFGHLVDWAEEHRKRIVCLDVMGGEADFTTGIGKVVGFIISWLAEEELKKVKERGSETKDKQRRQGKWSAKPLLGYDLACFCHRMPYDECPFGDPKLRTGTTLTVNPAEAGLVNEMADRVIAGESLSSIARDFHRRGEKTKSGSTDWVPTVMGRQLRNPVRRGYLVHYDRDAKGHRISSKYSDVPEIVLDRDTGMPLQAFDPIIDDGKWDMLQDKLRDNADKRARVNRYDVSLLSGIASCPCGHRFYPNHNYGSSGGQIVYDYYRLDSTDPVKWKTCPHTRSLDMHEIDAMVHGWIKKHDYIIKERVLVSGSDETDRQIEAIQAEIMRVTTRGVSGKGPDNWPEHIAKLNTRMSELKNTPRKEPEFEWLPVKNPDGTVQTIAAEWRGWTTQQKHKYLVDNGFEIEVYREVDEIGIISNREEWEKEPVKVKPEIVRCICGKPGHTRYGTCKDSSRKGVHKGDPGYECHAEYQRRKNANRKATEAGLPKPYKYDVDRVQMSIVPGWAYDAGYWGIEAADEESYESKYAELFSGASLRWNLAELIRSTWGKTRDSVPADKLLMYITELHGTEHLGTQDRQEVMRTAIPVVQKVMEESGRDALQVMIQVEGLSDSDSANGETGT